MNPSSISEDTVRHIAKLARLALSDAELASQAQELSKILDLVAELNAVTFDDMLPKADLGADLKADLPTTFRLDEAMNWLSVNASAAAEEDIESPLENPLLANAPQAEDGFYRVPKILEK